MKKKAKAKPQRKNGWKSRSRAKAGFWQRLSGGIPVGGRQIAPANLAAGAFLFLVLVYGLFAGGYVTSVLDGMLRSAGFVIAEVKIDGRENLARKTVLGALDIKHGSSIFAFNVRAAKKRLEKLSWVRSAVVTRLLPGTIRVVIDERRPLAIWQRGGRMSVIDENGVALSERKVADYATLPLIVGYGGAEKTRGLLEQLAKWPGIGARMKAAVRVADRRWNIKLRNEIEIKLPQEGMAAALEKLAELDRDQGLLSRDIKSVDLRIADRVTIGLGDEIASKRNADLKAEGSNKAGKRDKRI